MPLPSCHVSLDPFHWHMITLQGFICFFNLHCLFCFVLNFYLFSGSVGILCTLVFFLFLLKNQYRWLSSKSSTPTNSKSTFEEKFLSQQSQTSGLFYAVPLCQVFLVSSCWCFRLGLPLLIYNL